MPKKKNITPSGKVDDTVKTDAEDPVEEEDALMDVDMDISDEEKKMIYEDNARSLLRLPV